MVGLPHGVNRSAVKIILALVLVPLVSWARCWLARRVGPERPYARRARPVPRGGKRSGPPLTA
jgi:hypothetical protein